MAINYRPILNGEDRREILHLGLANYALNNGNDETAAKPSQIRILKTSPQDHGRVIQTGKTSYSATEVTKIMK